MVHKTRERKFSLMRIKENVDRVEKFMMRVLGKNDIQPRL